MSSEKLEIAKDCVLNIRVFCFDTCVWVSLNKQKPEINWAALFRVGFYSFTNSQWIVGTLSESKCEPSKVGIVLVFQEYQNIQRLDFRATLSNFFNWNRTKFHFFIVWAISWSYLGSGELKLPFLFFNNEICFLMEGYWGYWRCTELLLVMICVIVVLSAWLFAIGFYVLFVLWRMA